MIQFPLINQPSLTVSELTVYLRELIESDENLQDLWVLGEVSNLSRPSSGHLYFTLKDANASLRCVMWRSTVSAQRWLPKDGDAVEVYGYISIYEAGGQYQLYADAFRPAGEGLLYQQFLQLKAKLEVEGLFAAERKRPIPHWPQRIGIVTSPTAAAFRDVLNTLQRRYPLVEVLLAPVPVQGADAPQAIVAALQALERTEKLDVILMVRGGGSIEDLWAFNDERVARAIVATSAPVITGVGHATDFTIADFASDLRAPTPTAAAELATPNRSDLILALNENKKQQERAMTMKLAVLRSALENVLNRLRFQSPRARVQDGIQHLDELLRRSQFAVEHHLEMQKAHLLGLEQRLFALSSQAILNRGFAIVTRRDGMLVRSVVQVATGDPLNIRVSDGDFRATVNGN